MRNKINIFCPDCGAYLQAELELADIKRFSKTTLLVTYNQVDIIHECRGTSTSNVQDQVNQDQQGVSQPEHQTQPFEQPRRR